MRSDSMSEFDIKSVKSSQNKNNNISHGKKESGLFPEIVPPIAVRNNLIDASKTGN